MIKNFNKSNIRKINKRKLIIVVIILLLLILFAVFSILYIKLPTVRIFFDKYLFRKNVVENDLPYILNESSYVYTFKNNVLEQNKNTLTFYNKNGVKETSLDIKIVNPIVHTNGNFFVIAEKNGQKLYLISNKNIVWEKDVEGNISNVYVNENGYVAVSITGTTYKTVIDLYSEEGSELFKTYLSNTYVMDFAISPDNKYLALAEADLSGAIIESNIKIIDTNNAITNSDNAIFYKSETPSNNLIINIDYTKNNILSCIYDNHIDIINNNSVQEISNLETSNIIFADLNDMIVQIEKKSDGLFNSTYEIQIINSNTHEKKYYSLDKEPKSIKVFEDVIAINFGTEALFINNNCWLIKQYSSFHEIQDISISDNLAAIIYKNKTELISL